MLVHYYIIFHLFCLILSINIKEGISQKNQSYESPLLFTSFFYYWLNTSIISRVFFPNKNHFFQNLCWPPWNNFPTFCFISSIDVEEGIVEEACCWFPPEALVNPTLEFKLVNLKEVPWMASNLLIKPLAIASKWETLDFWHSAAKLWRTKRGANHLLRWRQISVSRYK